MTGPFATSLSQIMDSGKADLENILGHMGLSQMKTSSSSYKSKLADILADYKSKQEAAAQAQSWQQAFMYSQAHAKLTKEHNDFYVPLINLGLPHSAAFQMVRERGESESTRIALDTMVNMNRFPQLLSALTAKNNPVPVHSESAPTYKNKRARGDDDEEIKCRYCHKLGHTKYDCEILKARKASDKDKNKT